MRNSPALEALQQIHGDAIKMVRGGGERPAGIRRHVGHQMAKPVLVKEVGTVDALYVLLRKPSCGGLLRLEPELYGEQRDRKDMFRPCLADWLRG